MAERVSERVQVVDADARELPFPSASFDGVVSNLTIHNIPETAGRVQALSGAVRVLRPGGWLRIVDLTGADRYCVTLRERGCVEVTSALKHP